MPSAALFSIQKPLLVTAAHTCWKCAASITAWAVAGRVSFPASQRTFIANIQQMPADIEEAIRRCGKSALAFERTLSSALQAQVFSNHCPKCRCSQSDEFLFKEGGPFHSENRTNWTFHPLPSETAEFHAFHAFPINAGTALGSETLDIVELAPPLFERRQVIPRVQFLADYLPALLSRSRADPEVARHVLDLLVRSKCFRDALPLAAAEYARNSAAIRSVHVYADLLLRNDRLSEAEALLDRHHEFDAHPHNLILRSRAARTRRDTAAEQSLVNEAVATAPNDSIALGAYFHLSKSRRGCADKAFGALEELCAERPDAWLARCWIANHLISDGRPQVAMQHVEKALAPYRSGFPPPTPLMEGVLAHLSNRGHLHDAVDILAPHLNAAQHGTTFSLRLYRAAIEARRPRAAEGIRTLLRDAFARTSPATQSEAEMIAGAIAEIDSGPQV